MSEHYGPFEKYTEVMLDDKGVFGLRAGETLDVLENGDVEITSMPEPAEDVVEVEAPDEDVVEVEASAEAASDPTYEDEAPAKTPAEDESPPDAAAAFAEAQQNPSE